MSIYYVDRDDDCIFCDVLRLLKWGGAGLSMDLIGAVLVWAAWTLEGK